MGIQSEEGNFVVLELLVTGSHMQELAGSLEDTDLALHLAFLELDIRVAIIGTAGPDKAANLDKVTKLGTAAKQEKVAMLGKAARLDKTTKWDIHLESIIQDRVPLVESENQVLADLDNLELAIQDSLDLEILVAVVRGMLVTVKLRLRLLHL